MVLISSTLSALLVSSLSNRTFLTYLDARCVQFNSDILNFKPKSNQIKSHCRCGPAASLRYPGDDLTKPEYQWGFQPDKIHPRREKKKSDTRPNLSHVTSQTPPPNIRRQTLSTEVLQKEKIEGCGPRAGFISVLIISFNY